MKTNYSWIVPFSWVICVLRVDQILSIKSSVWTLFWTCRLNDSIIWHPKGTLQIGRLKSSKNSWYYVDITMAPIDSCFIIFCSPGTPTHSLLWSIHSCQNRMSNITRPYHCGLSCVFRRDYVLKFYTDQLMILRSGCHVTQKYLQHRNTKSLKVSQKVKFISSIIHISFRFLLVFASIYTDLPLRL